MAQSYVFPSIFFPANLYTELMALPREMLDSESTAIIVPAMFIDTNLVLPRCKTVLECAILSEELFPANKTDLLDCLQKRRCSTRKGNGVQHVIPAGMCDV